MMNAFFNKLAMLILFLASVTCGWCAVSIPFPITLVNILLLILAAFFLLRAFELADKINKLGPYAEDKDKDGNEPPRRHYRRDEVQGDDVEIPNEE